MKKTADLKKQLQKKWKSHTFHKAFLVKENLFPFIIRLPKITDKQMLHQFSEVNDWIAEINQFSEKNSTYLTVIYQQVNFRSLGKQKIPTEISWENIERLSSYLGEFKQWLLFVEQVQRTLFTFPALQLFLQKKPAELSLHLKVWPQLLSVCDYFLHHPKPNCYIREIAIEGIDSKFIESHRAILTKLLDQLLPESSINTESTGLSDYGFEKRFYLKYEQPRVRFRVLDPAITIMGLSDIEITVEEFSQLTLRCNKVFITENKTNGLAFPAVEEAIVIFGLGYGIRSLKTVSWLNDCQLYYWGDIDTHGFAMLAQMRGYFPCVRSFLMDQETLLANQHFWGEEAEGKAHQSTQFEVLNIMEQQLYSRLKSNYFQTRLRLEQEFIPFLYWYNKLLFLKG